jgi:hypothetical protein
MEVNLEIPMKAFSINSYYYASRKVKTKEAREWEEEFMQHLEEEKGLTDLALDFSEHGGTFIVSIWIQYPHHVFYNNQRIISSKTFDCSNTEKIIIDRIFGDKMQVNDKHITELHSYKEVGPRHCIKIRIQHLKGE